MKECKGCADLNPPVEPTARQQSAWNKTLESGNDQTWFLALQRVKTNHHYFHFLRIRRWRRSRRTWRAPSLSGSGKPKTSRNNWMHSGTSMSSRCVPLSVRLALRVRAWICSRVHKRSCGKSSFLHAPPLHDTIYVVIKAHLKPEDWRPSEMPLLFLPHLFHVTNSSRDVPPCFRLTLACTSMGKNVNVANCEWLQSADQTHCLLIIPSLSVFFHL